MVDWFGMNDSKPLRHGPALCRGRASCRVWLWLAMTAGCGAGDAGRDVGPSMSAAALSSALQVPLPAEATVLGVEHQQGMDDMVRAKIAVPRAHFTDFRRRIPVPPAAMEDKAGALLGTGPSWWAPDPSTRVGQAPLDAGRVLHLGIEDTGKPTVLVYLVNHGT